MWLVGEVSEYGLNCGSREKGWSRIELGLGVPCIDFYCIFYYYDTATNKKSTI